MPSVMRILDANANRAREAMRVMEDAARFLLDDAELSAGLKELRHDLAAAMGGLATGTTPLLSESNGGANEGAGIEGYGIELWRDTPGDVGTTLTTASEARRDSVADVAVAAGKRLSEALRVLEEFGKIIDPAFAGRIEAIRYRGYNFEQRLHQLLAGGSAKQWRLCVLISESLCPGCDWLNVAQAAMEGGADCLQLREKSLEADQLLDRARQLVALARPTGAAVIINDRPDVALLAGAHGVHLGQHDLPCREVRKLVGRQLLIGVSTSHLDEAKQARRNGADYCGVGPMFPTTTKHKDVIVGPAYLREYIDWNQLPHLAIGGITAQNVSQLIEVGARGVAVSSEVCAAADPAKACRAILEAMTRP